MASNSFGRKMIFKNNQLATDYINAHDIGIYYIGPQGNNGEVVLMYIENDKTDNVNHPAHYTSGGIECIDGMVAAFGREYVMHYCLCNAFKYIWRCEHKGKRVEDIQKAVWYLNKWQSLAGEEAMSDE